ncbi:MAG: hypothetical protein DHS20C11_14810 [Lysobacteraceae bacterium]|nr:MAG: hypothetical protein DHS20C11_14810 [Xanthomonadaceae bacterium]
MTLVVEWLSNLMLLIGGFFVLTGGIGAIRMPELYSRMHASSLTDTMGSMMVLGGLAVKAGFTLVTLKLGIVAVFLLFTSPVSAYALGNAALVAGYRPLADKSESAHGAESKS